MFDSIALNKAIDMLPYFLNVLGIGALTTVGLTAAAFVVATLLGFCLALMRLSRSRVLSLVASVYLEIFRNVPILTQLFILYFGLTYIGITLPAIGAAIIGFGLNGAAILSEVFRSSIRTIDRGQSEAAFSIGMTRSLAMRIIVLPQAFKVAIPGMANFAIGLLKDTSLASAAAVPELTFKARMLVSETYQTNLIYFLLATIYLLLSLMLSHWAARTERRLKVVKEH
ncbi:amino acid ABC transporter permease [Pseudomonas sp. 31-12]|uniref:amino acid ABC transporter permease n=1 Tax=Pseudomonas sp. 31-12 TaxID=2201356 RepID=UPI000D6ADE60|nr:amino acid ABC transporter permease [Pseudomonas sp. 31-12]AWM92645.1 amino acid ABC transporter permease [Pseudomonas sp. 31-12]